MKPPLAKLFSAFHRARVLQRPWDADPFLKAINYQMIQKSKSIAKQLNFTPFAAELFAANRARCGEPVMIAPNIRDFSYAPQRFVSEAKTLARLVIYFDAAMSTLSQVAAARGPTSEEGSASVETLEFLTEEVMLQMGMLADAAMETYSLVRECALLSAWALRE